MGDKVGVLHSLEWNPNIGYSKWHLCGFCQTFQANVVIVRPLFITVLFKVICQHDFPTV
jgi:hypothetical protein